MCVHMCTNICVSICVYVSIFFINGDLINRHPLLYYASILAELNHDYMIIIFNFYQLFMVGISKLYLVSQIWLTT